jgi:translation initiation factor IF-3
MTLQQAKEIAETQKKDAVLRSRNTTPPIVKIMEYRRDLMRKILTRLGKKKEESSDAKTKALHLSSNISSMDLENKKKQAIHIFKKTSILKIYLKLSTIDQASLSKGKIILQTFAQDLSQYCTVKVRPGFQGRQPVEIEKDTKEQKLTIEEQDNAIEEAEFKADLHDKKKDKDSEAQNMLYMELKSNIAQTSLDIDVETMLAAASLDDFMEQILKGKAEENKDFVSDVVQDADFSFNEAQKNDQLKRQALINLKKKRIELKQKSKIFLKEED